MNKENLMVGDYVWYFDTRIANTVLAVVDQIFKFSIDPDKFFNDNFVGIMYMDSYSSVITKALVSRTSLRKATKSEIFYYKLLN